MTTRRARLTLIRDHTGQNAHARTCVCSDNGGLPRQTQGPCFGLFSLRSHAALLKYIPGEGETAWFASVFNNNLPDAIFNVANNPPWLNARRLNTSPSCERMQTCLEARMRQVL